MAKYTKTYKNYQKKPNKKKKSPSDVPIWASLIIIIEFVVMLMLKIPDITSGYLITTVIVCICTYLAIAIAWKVRYRLMLSGASIERIDKMSGEEFEDYLAVLYKKHGFDVKMTPKTCDFGADLLLTDKKTGKKICAQAKRYRGLVGEAAVQQTLSGREYYSCDEAIIITNSHYTDAAKALAKRCGIKMIDRFSLGKEQMFLF